MKDTKTLIDRGNRLWEILNLVEGSRFNHRSLQERLEKEYESIESTLWQRAGREIYKDCVRFARNNGENQFAVASRWRDAILASPDFDVFAGDWELDRWETKSGIPHIISW